VACLPLPRCLWGFPLFLIGGFLCFYLQESLSDFDM
jgi:hypothetical protein